MPIYEYRCQSCGEVFEYQQHISDDPKTTCETCSGALERLISRSAFHLKGGGWYKDLYSSPKPGSDSKPAASTPSSPDSGSSKSDSGSGSSDKKSSGGSD